MPYFFADAVTGAPDVRTRASAPPAVCVIVADLQRSVRFPYLTGGRRLGGLDPRHSSCPRLETGAVASMRDGAPDMG